MKRWFAVFAGIAVLLTAAYGFAQAPSTPAASSAAATTTFFGPPRELWHYGHIKSLARTGGRFELRFDPAWWLGGETANRAAIEDKVIGPGETVPNDYYIRDETHRLLTYLVSTASRATVITNGPNGLRSTVVSITELAQIVKGRNPRRRPLYDRGNNLGFWILVATDRVRALDQQYQP